MSCWAEGGYDSMDYRHLFGISKSSVCFIIHDVYRAIVGQFAEICIKMPTRNELKGMNACFKNKFGFPSCDGPLDG